MARVLGNIPEPKPSVHVMSDLKPEEICKYITGKWVEIDPVTNQRTTVVYQRVLPEYANIGVHQSIGLQKRAYVIPSDPKTVEQLAQRDKMAQAVIVWQGMSEEEKEMYRGEAENSGLTRYQYFISRHMLGLI